MAVPAPATTTNTVPVTNVIPQKYKVKVWYEPPPYGPATDLNGSPHGSLGGGFGKWVHTMSKMNPRLSLGGVVIFFMGISYLPLMNDKLPFSFDPEYKAAEIAYERYHNMNPIFGNSRKQS